MNNDNLAPVTPASSPTPAPAPAAPAGPTPTPPKPAKSGGLGKFLMMLVVLLVVAAAAGWGGYAYGKSKAPVKTVTQTVAAAPLTVPQGATVLSQCAVGRGTQYALPKDIPTGPVYNVYKGKVIGLEFMVGKDDLFNGKNFLNLPMFNQKYDHVNIGLLSQGHAGFPVPHYHVDLFTVSDSVAKAITCSDTSSSSTSTSTSTTTNSSTSTKTQ